MVAAVTGSRGFLGHHVVTSLIESGWSVQGFGRPDVEIPSMEFTEQLSDLRPQLLVHCAGPASVAQSFDAPIVDFSKSVLVLAEVLELARKLEPLPRVVLVSSAAVYGEPNELPITEAADIAPISPYGFHRAASEQVLVEYNQLYGVPAAILRVFSAYGEGLRRQLLWDICRMALTLGRVELSGTGAESRDFVHGSDVGRVVASVAAGSDVHAEVYNVASGVETTTREVAGLLATELGLSGAEVTFTGRSRSGDPSNWCADIERITALGSAPKISIEEGAGLYARWVERQLANLAGGGTKQTPAPS